MFGGKGKQAAAPHSATSSPTMAASPNSTGTASFDGEELAMAALRRKNEVIDELQDEVASLKEKVDAMEQESDKKLHDKINDLTTQLGVAQRAQKRAENLAKDEVRQRQRQIVTQAAEIRRLQADVVEAQSIAQKHETKLQIVQQETKTVPLVAEEEQKLNKEAVKNEVQQMQMALDALNIELHEAEQRNERLLTSAEQAKSVKDAAEEKLQQILLDNDSLQRQVEQLKGDLSLANSGTQSGRSDVSSSLDLRAKDKQLVAQSSEILSLRTQVGKLEKDKDVLSQDVQRANEDAELCKSSQAKQKTLLDTALGDLAAKNEDLDATKKLKDTLQKKNVALKTEVDTYKKKCEDLRVEVSQFGINKAQLTTMLKTLEDKDARVVTMTNDLETMSEQLTVLEREKSRVEQNLEESTALALQKDEVHIAVVQRKETQINAMQRELDELHTSMDDMRKLLRQKTEAFDDLTTQLADVTAQRDQEREAWRTRTAQSEERYTAERANLKLAETQRTKHEEELASQIKNLTETNANLLQEKRAMEAKMSATAVEGAEKRTSVQRLSLEVEDLKLQLQRLQREHARKTDDYDRLVRRMCDLEGSKDDGTTASSRRRMVGVLESLSVEISGQLAEHLRLDYLRGGVKTADIMVQAFSLERTLATEVIQVLCRMMFLVRLGTPMKDIAAQVGSRENTIKRIITAFGKADSRWASGDRHEQLQRDTPAKAKVTFCGHERLAFLCAVNRDEGSVTGFQAHPWIQAVVCSFLPCVIRGAPFFASHSMVPQAADGKPQGHTAMIMLDTKKQTFQMLECEVSYERAIVVIVGGPYKLVVSKSTQANTKLALQCRTKRDGVCHRVSSEASSPEAASAVNSSRTVGDSPKTSSDPSSSSDKVNSSSQFRANSSRSLYEYGHVKGSEWQWSPEEKFPKEEAPLISYTIKWDSKHNGLIAESSSALLPETSHCEVTMLNELYGGDVSLGGMIMHRSWNLIPQPPMRRGVH